MFKKNETCERINQDEQAESREKIEITLRKLQALKDTIAELRRHCEELKKPCLENKVPTSKRQHEEPKKLSSESKASLCSKCGNAVEPSQDVIVKDSTGTEQRHYHMKCFQALLR